MMTLRYRDDVMDNVWNSFFGTDRVVEKFLPAYDVVEKANIYELTFELPGVDEEKINLEVNNRELTLEVKDQDTKNEEENSDKYHIRNRKAKNFKKVFKLPDDINTDDVTAAMKNGILTITIGKREEVLPKKIQVNIN